MTEEGEGVISKTWERHAQTVLALVLTALLIWVGDTTQKTAVVIGQLQVQMQHMTNERDDDQARLDKIEERLMNLERDLSSLHQEVTRNTNNRRNARVD